MKSKSEEHDMIEIDESIFFIFILLRVRTETIYIDVDIGRGKSIQCAHLVSLYITTLSKLSNFTIIVLIIVFLFLNVLIYFFVVLFEYKSFFL